MKKSILLIKIICFTITLCMLQSCVGSVVTTGAQAAYDHHNLQNSVYDQYVYARVDRAVHWYTKEYANCHVSVSVFNHVVILTGEVSSPELRTKLVDTVKNVPEVEDVQNLTTVGEPVSGLTAMSDTWITTKIKSQLIANNDIDPDRIKVITENGTVYLIGTVFPDQAEIATDIARQTSGVQSVVRVFSYLQITKHPVSNSGTSA